MAKLVYLLLVACALASTSYDYSMILSQNDIDYINKHTSWTASGDLINGMTWEQAKQKAGVKQYHHDFPTTTFGALPDYIVFPSAFDSRTQWPGCIGPVLDQGQCGDCWAFGASGTLSDRFCIQQQLHVELSAQWLTTCDTSNMGCNGGYPAKAWAYMQKKGIATEECLPFQSSNGQKTPYYCPSYCQGTNQEPKLYKATNIGGLYDPISIKTALMKSGPVEAVLTVYADLYAYKTGVYQYTKGREIGLHAVEIVGWGTDETLGEYWIVKNSWGTWWGMDGYFNIVFGNCGIDSQCFSGDAK